MTHAVAEPRHHNKSTDADGVPESAGSAKQPVVSSSPVSGSSENGETERPVREKLKKTSIVALSSQATEDEGESISTSGKQTDTMEDAAKIDNSAAAATTGSPRGRPTRKRSFDDLQNESTSELPQDKLDTHIDTETSHKRMRSRDMLAKRDAELNGKLDGSTVNTLVEEEIGTELKATERTESENVSSGLTSKESRKRQAKSEPEVLSRGESPESRPDGSEPTKSQHNDETSAMNSGNQSPKRKRSRDQVDEGSAEAKPIVQVVEEEVTQLTQEQERENGTDPGGSSEKGEPEKKRPRDVSQERQTNASRATVTEENEQPSGFANTSAISPFGALASPAPKPKAQDSETTSVTQEGKHTSSSAFAASSLSAFASSSKSPFGNLASSNGLGVGGGGFGSLTPKNNTSLGTTSPFGAKPPFNSPSKSGFGALGGAGTPFGSALGAKAGEKVTGFSNFGASGGALSNFGGSPMKPFGTPDNDDEKDDDDNDAASFGGDDEAKEQDSRFFEQPVETGEEEEDTLFSCRAKLFQNVDKEWKERGLGTVKLNIHYPVLSPTTPPPTSHHEDVVQSASDDGDPEKQDLAQSPEPPQQPQQKARLVMRTDGVHRVVLNTPIFKGMKFGTVDGSEPTGKMMNLTGIEDGKPALFLLKIGKEEAVKDLYRKIAMVHDELV